MRKIEFWIEDHVYEALLHNKPEYFMNLHDMACSVLLMYYRQLQTMSIKGLLRGQKLRPKRVGNMFAPTQPKSPTTYNRLTPVQSRALDADILSGQYLGPELAKIYGVHINTIYNHRRSLKNRGLL